MKNSKKDVRFDDHTSSIYQTQSGFAMASPKHDDENPKVLFKKQVDNINQRKLKKSRATSQYKIIEPGSSDEENGPELFIA